jgi:hypothetical protein
MRTLLFLLISFKLLGQEGFTMTEMDKTFSKEIKSELFKAQILYAVHTTEPVASLELFMNVYKYDELGNPSHEKPTIIESYEVLRYQKGKNPDDGIDYAILDVRDKEGNNATYQFIYDYDKGYSIILTDGKSNPIIIRGDLIF